MPAQKKGLTAAALLSDADVKEFIGSAKFDREDEAMGSPNIVSVRVMNDETFSHYLMVYLEPLPEQIKNYPTYAKDRVEQSAEPVGDSEKKLSCQITGAEASGCKEVDSPLGSYRDGQRVVKVAFGKGRNFVRVEAFRDYKADLAAAVKLAEKIAARLP